MANLFGDALGGGAAVDDGGRRHDEGEVVLALQPLLNDVHVQHPQKPAPESKTHCTRHLHTCYMFYLGILRAS